MKNRFLAGIVSVVLMFQMSGCVSLEDRRISKPEAAQAEVLGTVSDTFTSMQGFNMIPDAEIKKAAYERLLKKAQEEYGPDVDVRNIVMKGGFSGWEILWTLGLSALGAGVGALIDGLAILAYEDEHTKDMEYYNQNQNDGYSNSTRPEYNPPAFGLWTGIGAGVGLGTSLLFGNYQKITATGDVVAGSGYTPPAKTADASSAGGSAVSNPKGTGQEGVYIGIISFAATAEDITGGAPIYLDQAGYTQLRGILDTGYGKLGTQGTSLFYAVHKGLANLASNVLKFPPNLDSVNLLTFTDGLDNNSTALGLQALEGQNFGGKQISEYQQYIKTQIGARKIAGKSITAYSAGVKGNDVSDPAGFTTALKSLASTDQNFYELSNFSQLNTKFAEIADKLTVITRDVNFAVLTPSYPVGTKVRMTFDVSKNDSSAAANSQRYLQGEVTVSNRKYILTNITYKNMSSSVGTSVTAGDNTGTEVTYLFTGLQGYDPNQKTSPVLQWHMQPGSTVWQINSEYDVGDKIEETIEKKSTVIYLVLDASNSLGNNDVISIREAAKGFIQTLYDKTRN